MTVIGAGTAFTLLLLLTVLIAVVGWVVLRLERRLKGNSTEPSGAQTSSGLAEAKALAAVVGVTAAMQEESARQGKPPSQP